MDFNIDIKLLRETSKVPTYETSGAAACDLYADIDSQIEIKPGERKLIPTGVSIGIKERDIVALVYARSGLAYKQGITLGNAVGVIDSDYRGEIGVCLYNISDTVKTVKPGDRVAQLCFTPIMHGNFNIVESLDITDRGSEGFGSTGV